MLRKTDIEEPTREEWLEWITRFHGHLGPYAVIGFRMGEVANERLTPDPFGKRVVIKSGRERPLSCLMDGVQLSSCCTLGKGMIEVTDDAIPESVFTHEGKTLTLRLKDEIWEEIKTGIPREENDDFSRKLFFMDVKNLLDAVLE